MSRSGPYQGEPDWQPGYRPRQGQRPQDYGPPEGYGQQETYGRAQGYGPPQGYGRSEGYGSREGGSREGYGPSGGFERYHGEPYPPERRQRPPAPPPRQAYDDDGPRLRLPGLGLLLTLLGLVVQVLSLLVLPWVSASATGGESVPLPELWDLVTGVGASGFGGWYVFLFSYPLAALGILLALVSVLESVAMKVVWAGLAILGVGYLVLRYGLLELFGDGGPDLSRAEIITVGVAVGVLVLVIFMLRTAMAMFRRVAGLVLLALAAVHVLAVRDFAGDPATLDIGAYGPALGFVLSGVAALVGPRRLTPG
ncbi:hypothetical protein [Actinophytocola xanthii]|uniref:Uncharacterized protein n=1 Tax=Actinophytocola xanthii TaxID=1912961 RepID=A0A1Q8C7L1_9PSEU|nr:hypothetical protein [Actinophytocola xanthii]OLF10344.1 hypothetical protein BU204_32030 [Actinophytocola xanthii]